MSFIPNLHLPFSRSFIAAALMSIPVASLATSDIACDVTITTVTVNGEADSANLGTTCKQTSPPLPAA
jgi:hypothetical protein